jgi:(heptosyl)LPS beta-1,4-glucosyltransferase
MSDRASQSEGVLDLSVIIPCRNNVRTMGRVLDSVRGLCSQLVVIDSGSTDGTLELIEACREWCEVVLVQTHWRGFVRTSSMGLEMCNREYGLWLDSDEPVSEEMAASVRRAVGEGVDAGKVRRVVEYQGRLLMNSWQPEWRMRLIKMELIRDGHAGIIGINPHNYLHVDDGHEIRALDGVLIHDSFETFSEHLQNQLRLARASALALHDLGKETNALKMALSPLWSFFKQAMLKGSWRDGRAGWLAASTTSAGTLMKHMILYELGRGN